MASLVEKLTASGGTESAGFLNDIVEQLWPHIGVAAGRMTKEIVEPMFATMLPGPLATLRFAKIDLGNVPFKFSEVDVHKTENDGIKLDMDLSWEGTCDIDLKGDMIPKLGIEHVHLKGRLSILLCPLTDIIPLIGAAQVAFINPPEIKLDFTNAANIADCFLVEKAVRKTILSIVSSMAVLPNRYLVKLDANNDFFKTHVPHLGVLRLTVGKATGVTGPKKSGAKRLLDKLIKDVPDCYCTVAVGAEEPWRTSTKKDDRDPVWNETRDFLVTDYDQLIAVDVQDDDLVGDDDVGVASITVKDILLGGGTHEMELVHKGEPTSARITLHADFYNFVADAGALSAAAGQQQQQQQQQGGGGGQQLLGLATVLVAGVRGLQGQRDELNPSVKVSWGARELRTAARTYTPGTDIFNPTFDTAFRIPVTHGMLDGVGVGGGDAGDDAAVAAAGFKITLMNGDEEAGAVEIPLSDVLGAPGLTVADTFDVGSGVGVRASISLRGLERAP